ncbi:MAG: undecaprenyl-diphosphate phosphatase [Bacteroides sp.]|nr:undecaprenyl-diphosphate phosphatase [Bacteroides sp.]
MNWLEALILGLIQGLTEYLPVSSSGHLAIGSAMFGLDMSGEQYLTFAIAVHAATMLSTIVVLWKEIEWIVKGVFNPHWNDEKRYAANLLLSMIPIGIVGFVFKDQLEAIFEQGGLYLVGAMLLVTAVLLTFSYYARPRQKDKISARDALIIGISQACAVFPGLSRSGTTIATGLLLGNRKEAIAQFSFLMVLAPIAGEALLDLMQGQFSPAASGIPTVSLIVGFIAAFISGCFACRWMINIVKKGKLVYFAVYCALAGVAVLIFSFLQH